MCLYCFHSNKTLVNDSSISIHTAVTRVTGGSLNLIVSTMKCLKEQQLSCAVSM